MARLRGLDTTMELTRFAPVLRELHGFDFAMRYYSHNPAKNLSLREARALSAAGLQVGAVWETAGTSRTFFTLAQGVADGSAAFQMAHHEIGQPFDSAIYFAVDYDATQDDIDGPVSDYFTGVHAGLYAAAAGEPSYAVGVYGSGLCCECLREREVAFFSWLSQSTRFAGSEAYARGMHYNVLQYLPQRLTIDGTVLSFDPNGTNPDRPAGLFRV